MPILFVLLLPFFELWLLIKIGSQIGALTTIALLIFSGMLGMQLLRIQGFSTLLKINQKMAGGEAPAQEAIEGIMLALAGALFVFPGFISDMIAIIFVIPFIRRLIARRWLKRIHFQGSVHFGTQQNPFGNDADITEGDILEGEFTEVKPEDRRLN